MLTDEREKVFSIIKINSTATCADLQEKREKLEIAAVKP
jgi:hypothetical protein